MNFRSKELNFEDQTFNRYSKEIEEAEDAIYQVKCDCGWFGMREDCSKYGTCPNCGDRVRRDK